MGLDFGRIAEYLNESRRIENILTEHQELFDGEKLVEFKQITDALEKNFYLAQQESRKLSIGIVGAVKAGKSSFLNACVFDGDEYLPKAATPMTAALTKISYSETPKAYIHFYSKEDWRDISEHANKYDVELQKAYDEYCNRMQKQMTQASYANYGMSSSINFLTKEEYEKRSFTNVSETQKGSKELVRMAVDPELMSKLGETDVIEGNIIEKLTEYVGANGKYTPIVSYVELQVDNPYVKDLEIVDTPGLNDPIVSRGIKTKQFLRSCNVVLLLSPCSQFMDQNTVSLMANRLPDAGVSDIIVVGSKLDSGILNESTKDFQVAYKKAVTSYKKQFINSMDAVRGIGRYSEMIDKLGKSEVLFVSSTCYSIVKKKRKNVSLNSEEEKVYSNLHRNFSNFEDKYLVPIGGIKKVRDVLEIVRNRKAEIIEKGNETLLENAKVGHLRVLEKVLNEIVSSRSKLESTTADELKQRTLIIRDVIDSSREKLLNIFDGAIIKCDEKVQQILPQLTVEMSNHQSISVDTTKRTEHDTVKTGFFGLKRETVYYEVTEHGADTSVVIDNIKQYASRCRIFVNEEFKQIFNKELFSSKIKDVVLKAFRESQRDFDEDDILLPLQNVLDRISIPHIEFDFTKYIDEVETRFKNGYAKNEEIHQLKNLQSKLLNRIEEEFGKQLMDVLIAIETTLKQQAVSFADQISNSFCNELEKLKGQVEEREKYIKKYIEFAENIRTIKDELSNK